jgi:hypothetical protein
MYTGFSDEIAEIVGADIEKVAFNPLGALKNGVSRFRAFRAARREQKLLDSASSVLNGPKKEIYTAAEEAGAKRAAGPGVIDVTADRVKQLAGDVKKKWLEMPTAGKLGVTAAGAGAIGYGLAPNGKDE